MYIKIRARDITFVALAVFLQEDANFFINNRYICAVNLIYFKQQL